MLHHMLNDRVTLVKKDGTLHRENIPALVTKGRVQVHDTTIPIEIGDHLLRKLPNGLVEDYVVDDPVLQSGLGSIEAFYIVHVSRSGQPLAQPQAVIQNITNNFHGANSRVNIHSADLSTNISTEIDVQRIKSFVEQVKPVVGELPKAARDTIVEPLTLLEDEIRSGVPSPPKVKAALESIRSIAEGVAGNLIAAGIVALTTPMLPTIG